MKTANIPLHFGPARFRLRTFFIGVTIVSFIVAYGAAYYRISRRGMSESMNYGLTGFLYVPSDEAFASENFSRHHQLSVVFTPANWIDQYFFGGPRPVVCVMVRIS